MGSFVALAVVAGAAISLAGGASFDGPADRVRPCEEIQGGRAVCRLDGATITVTAGGIPLLLPDLELRVTDTHRTTDRLDVRLRVRNPSAAAPLLDQRGSRFRLAIGTLRLRPREASTPVVIPAQEASMLTLTFDASPAALSSLERLQGRAELHVLRVPAQGRTRGAEGAVRLTFPPAVDA